MILSQATGGHKLKKIPGNLNFENSPAAKKVSRQIRHKHNRILMEFEIKPLR